ncbi:MAG: hypothetical protein C0478_09825 [Planctomyces sp.]|nr:hypothetical protein [Planctomyces sp.]
MSWRALLAPTFSDLTDDGPSCTISPANSARIPAWTQTTRRWTPAATWTLWAVLAVVICGFYLKQQYRSVAINYRKAAIAWRAGEDMYNTQGDGFLYLPQAALVFLPLTYLPVPVGDVFWRLLGMAWLALALRRFCHLLHPTTGDAMFWLVTLVTLPLSFSAFRNGQSTIHMTAAMLSVANALADRRWTMGACWLCVGFAFKPLIVVMLLLAGAAYPAIRLRLAVGLVILALTPFLCQWPSYVIDQYGDMLRMLRISYEVGETKAWYAHFYGALAALGWNAPAPVQTGTRLLIAGLTLGAFLITRKRLSQARAAGWLFLMSVTYLMLFNPRTEPNTYACVAPAVGWMLFEAALSARWILTGVHAVLAFLIVGNFELGRLITAQERSVWLAPLATTVFAVLAFRRWLREVQAVSPAESNQVSSPTSPRLVA